MVSLSQNAAASASIHFSTAVCIDPTLKLSTCLILPSGGFQPHSLLLDLRGEVGILGAFPGQRSCPIAKGVLHHFEDVPELFQAFLGGLSLLALALYRALKVFDRRFDLSYRFMGLPSREKTLCAERRALLRFTSRNSTGGFWEGTLRGKRLRTYTDVVSGTEGHNKLLSIVQHHRCVGVMNSNASK